MIGAAAYRVLHDAGLTARLEAGSLIVAPSELLDDALRAFVRHHKTDLIQCLADAERIAAPLLAAAMRVCNRWNDSPAARDQMRQDVLATPPHLRQDLLDHFNDKT